MMRKVSQQLRWIRGVLLVNLLLEIKIRKRNICWKSEMKTKCWIHPASQAEFVGEKNNQCFRSGILHHTQEGAGGGGIVIHLDPVIFMMRIHLLLLQWGSLFPFSFISCIISCLVCKLFSIDFMSHHSSSRHLPICTRLKEARQHVYFGLQHL